LGGATTLLTRNATSGRKRVIMAAAFFPFLCLAWGAGVFVFQGIVNEALLHRDLGLGDTWHAPLPNGYQVMMIDDTDRGWVYNPKTQGGPVVGEQEDAVADVSKLQVANQYILAETTADPRSYSERDRNQPNTYLLLDTAVGRRTQFQNYEALRGKALELNIKPDLEPINTVYSRYRFGWFDILAVALFFLAPAIGAVLLIRSILRIRRTRPIMSVNA